MTGREPRVPFVTYITDTRREPPTETLSRVARLEVLPLEVRRRIAFQLRDPELSAIDLLTFGDLLRTATDALGIKLFVNDRVDLAIGLDADGVHLGRESMSVADARALLPDDAFISVACHDEDDVLAAARSGADACTLSPIYESPGKLEPIGLRAIVGASERLAANGLALPIVALGGIDEDTFHACLRSGASGVAMIRAELAPGDIVRSLR